MRRTGKIIIVDGMPVTASTFKPIIDSMDVPPLVPMKRQLAGRPETYGGDVVPVPIEMRRERADHKKFHK